MICHTILEHRVGASASSCSPNSGAIKIEVVLDNKVGILGLRPCDTFGMATPAIRSLEDTES